MSIFDRAGQGASSDIVGIFDANFRQRFANARPINAAIKETSKFMEHPVEDGTTIVDHKVIEPIEIDFSLILKTADYHNTYSQLRQAWLGGELFSVQTRAGTYPNMAFVSIPHDETVDMFGTIPVALKMREVKIVETRFETLPPRSVKNQRDSDTKARGNQPAAEAPAPALRSEIIKFLG
jgi:hypothetical protein